MGAPQRVLGITICVLAVLSLTRCESPTTPKQAPSPPMASLEVTRGTSVFDGVYTSKSDLPGGFTHIEIDVVSGRNVVATHNFSNGGTTAFWVWTGTITPSATNPNTGTIVGAGKKVDLCCGSILFRLDHGDIAVNGDGSGQLNYTSSDPRFGAFGNSSFRTAPLSVLEVH